MKDNINVNKNRIVLHVGYHKTGTTFLQKNVFKNHPEIVYLGQPFINKQIGFFFQRLKDYHDLEINTKKLREEFFKIIDDITELDINVKNLIEKNAPILISLESLHSGIDWFGRELVVMANRLKDIFFNPQIIIGYRKQAEYIESHYKEYIIHGGRLSWNYYLYNSHYFKLYFKPKLFFDLVSELYFHVFSKQSVFIYFQEELLFDSENTIEQLMRFIGVKSIEIKNEVVYSGFSASSAEVIRFVNRIFVVDAAETAYNRGRYIPWGKKEIFRRNLINIMKDYNKYFNRKINYTTEDDKKYIHTLFCESNKKLSKLINRDIDKYGYF